MYTLCTFLGSGFSQVKIFCPKTNAITSLRDLKIIMVLYMCSEQTSVANGMYWDGSKHNASDVPQTTILFYRIRRDKGLF